MMGTPFAKKGSVYKSRLLIEQAIAEVKKAGQKKVAGERSVSVGSLITFLIGALIIGYSFWKKESLGIIGGLVLIFAGDLVF